MIISKHNFKIVIFPVIIAASFFMSCKDKTETTDNTNQTTQEVTLEQKKQALEHVSPTTNSNVNTSGDLALNPAHGQPGHRCDIPVGSPLNAAAEKSTASPISGSGEVNPPHGQPGHRCDIKVGDPL